MNRHMLKRGTQISFSYNGYVLNTLSGFARAMDITAMRDTITPIADNGRLDMYVEADGQKIAGYGTGWNGY